ncbi:hypothetical protein B0T24DRAFT_211167 [Lasiosphaeria ovina]|uniref:Uncharacterized protein n=1 Tax=Lasiosphaeria ovina TaxID=92902 RepID=A0AAE0NAZ9_9PEZI|nr:hypothetical protein B0T24DRAFT_211167 [Lasiosphaeria ovina]
MPIGFRKGSWPLSTNLFLVMFFFYFFSCTFYFFRYTLTPSPFIPSRLVMLGTTSVQVLGGFFFSSLAAMYAKIEQVLNHNVETSYNTLLRPNRPRNCSTTLPGSLGTRASGCCVLYIYTPEVVWDSAR